jgi:CRISPR-associated Csx14 family protein
MGLSPGVVTEAIDYVQNKLRIKIDKVLVVTTAAGYNDYFNFLSTYVEKEMSINIEPEILPKEDIKNYNDQLEMMGKMRDAILRSEPNKNNVIVNIAGGRKTMSADLLILSYMFNVDYAIHVLSDSAEEIWRKISQELKNKNYDELNQELKEKVKQAFQPNDLTAVVYPLFLLKGKHFMKAVYLYLEGNPIYASQLKYKNKTLKDYVDEYRLSENKEMLKTLISFLENSIPDPAVEKERYQFKEGWHPPKDINSALLMKIIKEIEELDFVYKINPIDFRATSKEIKAEESGYTNYELDLAGAIINVIFPIRDTHAIKIEVHTTAYTRDQIKYAKENIKNILDKIKGER